jgi:hypothetical protein
MILANHIGRTSQVNQHKAKGSFAGSSAKDQISSKHTRKYTYHFGLGFLSHEMEGTIYRLDCSITLPRSLSMALE